MITSTLLKNADVYVMLSPLIIPDEAARIRGKTPGSYESSIKTENDVQVLKKLTHL